MSRPAETEIVDQAGTTEFILGPSAEPIRFPHIPSRFRTPPTNQHFNSATGHWMRADSGFTPAATPSSSPAANETVPREATTANLAASPSQNFSASSRPTLKSTTSPSGVPAPHSPAEFRRANQNAEGISVQQVAQIAEFLRRKRDELESENSDFAIQSWQQQQLLLAQRDGLRQAALAVNRLKSATELLRCELIEMGHSLMESFGEDSVIFQRFSQVCEAYAQVAESARQLPKTSS